jgi:pentatricopeptide repeat protein
MLAVGIAPNNHTYTALLTVMGRNGLFKEALDVFTEMRAKGETCVHLLCTDCALDVHSVCTQSARMFSEHSLYVH